MGYTTEFTGRFKLNRPLYPTHAAYLAKFADTRRMLRSPTLIDSSLALADPLRVAVGLPLGDGGVYFVGGKGFMGQDSDPSVLDQNRPHGTQPGLWCQWVPSEDRKYIEWNQREKFYDYVSWLRYIIEHFLKPWGYVLDGRISYQGEDRDDFGELVVDQNVVSDHPKAYAHELLKLPKED